jgi:chemotaxis protein CheD
MSLQTIEQIGHGDIRVSNDKKTVLSVPNIGSSIVLCAFDYAHLVAGVAHVMLPDSGTASDERMPGKFANLAIPLLIQQMETLGGNKETCWFKLIGGAQMFNFGGGGGNPLNIGSRNAIAIRAALSKQGIPVEKSDVGGNKGRSFRFVVATGQLAVQQIGGEKYYI